MHTFILCLLTVSCQHIWCVSSGYKIHIRCCFIFLKFRFQQSSTTCVYSVSSLRFEWQSSSWWGLSILRFWFYDKVTTMLQGQLSQLTFSITELYFYTFDNLFALKKFQLSENMPIQLSNLWKSCLVDLNLERIIWFITIPEYQSYMIFPNSLELFNVPVYMVYKK